MTRFMLLFIFKKHALRFVLYESFNDENDTKQTPKKNTNFMLLTVQRIRE